MQQQQAQQVLTQFQENPDSWQRVPAILESSNNLSTKVSVAGAWLGCFRVTNARSTLDFRSSRSS